MTEPTLLYGGRVVTPREVIEDGCVLLSGAHVTHVGPSPPPTVRAATDAVDVGGRVVLPGLVDLHGDDIERQLYPRSGARVDASTALVAADRANLFAGVTTKFHAVAFEDDPADNRCPETAAGLCREIATADYTLGDNRVHARCELADGSVAAVEALLADVPVDLLSVMHHAPGDGQFDEAGFREHYAAERDCSSAAAERLADERASTPRAVLEERLGRVVALAAREGIPLASHDDERPSAVDAMVEVGASISEYPVTRAAAARATERGMVTAMGAPNLVRGGSLRDNLDARSAARDGLVDVLCSDYHPPSLLSAAFVDTGEPLADRVRRVTAAPADAVGLTDRGRLEPGARADVLVVDPDPVPTVDGLFVTGRDLLCTL